MPTIRFNLNHQAVSLNVDGERTPLWVLRTDLGLTGAKYGCGAGLCGACTVLINEEAVQACQTAIKDVAGADVITIEGLAENRNGIGRQSLKAAAGLRGAGHNPHWAP